MQQVTLIGAAAWHISGKLSFERACSETSRMEGHVAEGQPVLESTEDSTRTLCVTAISLDDYIYRQGGKPPNLLKLDVEGAEGEVARGAARLFHKDRPGLLCEVHNAAAASFIGAWLREKRYKVEWFLNGGSFPCSLMAQPE